MESKKTKRQIQYKRKIERCRRLVIANIYLVEVQRENKRGRGERGKKQINISEVFIVENSTKYQAR